MAGPKALSRKRSDGVRGRNVEATNGAPLSVSDNTNARNLSSTTFLRESGSVGVARMELAQRPSTAGGTSSRRPLYQQETRDDLHCGPLTSNKFHTTYFNFPVPTSVITPAATPKSSRSPSTSSAPHAGLNQMAEDIGMALGSPTQHGDVWSSHVRFQQASPRRYTPESLEDWVSPPPPKSKSNKWKILGGLFARKPSAPPAAFYQLRPEELRPDRVAFPSPPSVNRGWTASERKLSKPRPRIKRANTVPIDFQFQESNRPKEPSQNPLPQTPPPEPSTLHPSKSLIEGVSLLDVEIPTIELERYSVMFGDLIEQSSTSTSSLLARRQAILDRLRMVTEKLAEHKKEPEGTAEQPRLRRATSPQPTRSPSMTLFPPPLRAQRGGLTHAPLKPSPLHRSNTSPAALSPNRLTFEPRRAPPPPPEARPEPPPKNEYYIAVSTPSPASLRPTATLAGPWLAESSFLLPLSPNSLTSEITEEEEEIEGEEEGENGGKRHQEEPVWEMVTPAPISKFNPAQRVKSAQNSAVHVTQPKHPRAEHHSQSPLEALAAAGAAEEADKMVETAAKISIARQISVSRQQRQLLVSVRPINIVDTTNQPKKVLEEILVTNDKSMTPKIVTMKSKRVDSELVIFDHATIYQS